LLDVPHGQLKGRDWLARAEERMNLLKQRVGEQISCTTWHSLETAFDQAFPQATHLSPQRKADLMIWASYQSSDDI
jgi:hypothetical protein